MRQIVLKTIECQTFKLLYYIEGVTGLITKKYCSLNTKTVVSKIGTVTTSPRMRFYYKYYTLQNVQYHVTLYD